MSGKLDSIKFRCGIYYSDKMMDAAIQAEIDSCKEYMKAAGVPETLLDSERATTAIVLWIKRSQNMDAESIVTDPAFIALLGQLRAEGDAM